MKYVQNCVAPLLASTALLLLLLSSPPAPANSTASAEGFLKHLLSAEHYGMGGSFAADTRSANAVGSNPAGISDVTGSRSAIHVATFPKTAVTFSKPNLDANYEEYSRYEEGGYGIETLNWVFPAGNLGAFGLSVAFEQAGSFRRVNSTGKALNSFPENNIALGVSYGVTLFRGTALGVDTKWLRSKVLGTDGDEHFGHGYAYNLGIRQRFGESLQVGAVLRNLSNGLSFTDTSIADRIDRSFVAGIAYQREVSDITVRVGLDVNPPFSDGFRVNTGVAVWYRAAIGLRLGYLRDIQNRYTSVFLLESGTFETEERLWKAEGVCIGLGFRLAGLLFNAAYTPPSVPVVPEDARAHIVEGSGVYAFSLGQVF